VHGWRFFDYVSYQRYRYTLRPSRWALDKLTRDEAMAEHLQLADMLCFSSQYYFLISGHAWGALLFFLGLVIQIQWGKVVFSDWVFIIYYAIFWAVLMVMRRLWVRGASAAGLWHRKSLEGTVEDEVGTRIAIGEGDSAALARERLDLAALNSERFRMRFLERARPWLISQLPAMLTPRMLAKVGADGQSHLDYIRSVYEGLIKMDEHAKLTADRRGGGTAEDEEESKLDLNRNIEWATRAPPSGQGKAIALHWLNVARRSLRYRTIVKGVMEAARRPKCDLCSQHEGLVGHLRIDLAKGGRLDPFGFDTLVDMWEAAVRRTGVAIVEGPKGVDAAGWKVFFRDHATYFMRCEGCVAAAADAARTVGQREEFGAAARERRKVEKAAELAYMGIDEDDDNVFEPMAVDPRSPAGRALTKWLRAARLRIGGTYPKPAAREEMALYAERAAAARARRDEKLLKSRGRTVGEKAVEVEAALYPPWAGTPAQVGLARAWLFGARASLFTKLFEELSRALEANEALVVELSTTRNVEGAVESRALGAVLVGEGRDVLKQVRQSDRDMAVAIAELARRLDVDVHTREETCVRGSRATTPCGWPQPHPTVFPPPSPHPPLQARDGRVRLFRARAVGGGRLHGGRGRRDSEAEARDCVLRRAARRGRRHVVGRGRAAPPRRDGARRDPRRQDARRGLPRRAHQVARGDAPRGLAPRATRHRRRAARARARRRRPARALGRDWPRGRGRLPRAPREVDL